MKRRALLIIVAALALAGLAGPASALGEVSSSYWGCVAVDDLDIGVCLKNPVPELPKLPPLPKPGLPV